jgi:hypothetical protein
MGNELRHLDGPRENPSAVTKFLNVHLVQSPTDLTSGKKDRTFTLIKIELGPVPE